MTTNNPTFYDLLEEVDGLQSIAQEVFAVTDLASADWCLRKVAAAERRIQARRALVEQRKAELDSYEKRANKVDLATTERMAEYLKPWAEQEMAQDGRRKSVSLPTGTVGFRQEPDSIEVTDAERVVMQLEALGHADLVRVKKEVDKRGLMEHVKAGGGLPEGCELRAGERRFYLKVGE